MKTINIITVVPISLAADLEKKKKIINYNTLPQLHSSVIESVREFMTDNVGYDYLPMACLNINERTVKLDSTELFHFLPANNKENVLFIMQVPEDMIVSVKYQDLLDSSQEAFNCEDDGDESSLEFVKEEFKDKLMLGQGGFADDDEIIEFIPFLDYNRCKGYSKFNENFETDKFDLPGVSRCSLAKLDAFIN